MQRIASPYNEAVVKGRSPFFSPFFPKIPLRILNFKGSF